MQVNVKVGQVMDNENADISELDALRLVQMVSPRVTIVVAAYSGDGRQRAEFVENAGFGNIAAMNNVMAATQKFLGGGPQQIVRVGDDAYSKHAGRWASVIAILFSAG